MADLITQDYLAAALADYQLTANATAQLPALAAAASRLVRDWCNRQFTRQTFDELYTVDRRSPLVLDESPVNQVLRLSTNPTAVLTVGQSDTTTNQRATAQLATTGNADVGLVVTGLTLTRYASGVAYAASFPFSASVTIQALAAAIVAYGQGWTAAAVSPYGLYPTADFRAVQGVLPALGANVASLKQHVDDLPFNLDERTGILDLCEAGDDRDPWSSPSWGPTQDTSFGDTRVRGGYLAVRCLYDAGFDTVPEAVQQATVEVAKAMLERNRTDSTLNGEGDGVYQWTARISIDALPDSVRQTVALYRSTRA